MVNRNETKKIVIKCPKCGRNLRIPSFYDKRLLVKCPNPNCRTEFFFDCRKYRARQSIIKRGIYSLSLILFIANVALPFVLIPKLNITIAKVKDNYKEKIENMKSSFSNEVSLIRNKHAKKIAKISRYKLREKAMLHYREIWRERKNYNSKYAMTSREKAQLEMLTLANDRTKNIEEIIKSIAIKAAPKNSKIKVYTSRKGVRLDINFDMSELSSGEKGTRTKHLTVNSLKQEVIKLISKATNDVYGFCKDLDLDTIAIGCKHFVGFHYSDGSIVKKNTILYKIRLDKKDIKKLEHNPFLNIYSITEDFKVEVNDFPNLYIKVEKGT